MNRISRLLGVAMLLTLAAGCEDRQAGLDEYHEALALMDQGDAPSALERLEQAAERATTDSLLALVYSQMGTLYFSQRILDRAMQSYRQAYAIDERAADTLGLIYDLRDMGNVLRATDDRTDSCVVCFEQARQLAAASGHLAMQHDVESQLAAYHLFRNHLSEARQLLMPAVEQADSGSLDAYRFMLADYYHRAGQRDSAIHYYNILLQGEANIYARQMAHRVLAEQAIAQGNSEQALQHLQRYEELTDSIYKLSDAESVRRTAALYDYTRHQQKAARLQRTAIIAVAVGLLVVLIACALLLYFRQRRRYYRLQVQRLEELLKASAPSNLPQLGEASKVTSAAEDGVATSPQLGGMRGAEGTRGAARLQQLLADPRHPSLPDEEWADVEQAVEQASPSFLHRLETFCQLAPQERRVCLLLRLGIPPAGIAQLTAHTRQAVTNTRSRLYRKAFGRPGTPAEWDEFICSL